MAFSRKDPRGEQSSGSDQDADGELHDHLHRDDVPGELEHASGDADQFEAALVSGAGGEPYDPDDLEVAETHEVDLAKQADEAYPAAKAPATRPDATADAPRGPGRFLAFLRASWAELQRVQWPDRRQVGQATAVVLGFVVIAGLYLGLADYVAQQVVDFIL